MIVLFFYSWYVLKSHSTGCFNRNPISRMGSCWYKGSESSKTGIIVRKIYRPLRQTLSY